MTNRMKPSQALRLGVSFNSWRVVLKYLFSPRVIILSSLFYFSLRLLTFIQENSVNVLFWDQWDYYLPLFNKKGIIDIFLWQHGPHRQGLAFVIESIIANLTRWNTSVISMASGVYLIAAAIVALLLKKRLFGSFHYADIVIPILVLTLSQYSNLIGDPNAAYGAFPLLLIFLYVYSWTISNKILRYSLVLLFNFFLIYSGFGIIAGIITITILLLDVYQNRRFKQKGLALPIVSFSISVISLGSFFVDYRFYAAIDCFSFPHKPLWDYLFYIVLMFANFIGLKGFTATSLIGGFFIVLTLFFILIKNIRQILNKGIFDEKLSLAIVVFISYSFFFAAAAAVGRVCSGVELAQRSRYMTYLIPAFLALYFQILKLGRTKIGVIGLSLFIVMIIFTEFQVLSKNEVDISDNVLGKKYWKSCYLQYEDVAYCNKKANFEIFPRPDEIKYRLEYLKEEKLNLFSGQ